MQEALAVQEMIVLSQLVFVPGMQLSDVAVNLLMYRYSDSVIMPYLSLNGFIPFMIRMDRMMSEHHGNSNDAVSLTETSFVVFLLRRGQ